MNECIFLPSSKDAAWLPTKTTSAVVSLFLIMLVTSGSSLFCTHDHQMGKLAERQPVA